MTSVHLHDHEVFLSGAVPTQGTMHTTPMALGLIGRKEHDE